MTLAHPTSGWPALRRLLLATAGQYVLIIIAGAVLSIVLGSIFGPPDIARESAAEEFRELLEGMLLMAHGAVSYSWPAIFVLLLLLVLLRGYGRHWPAWQRWGLLLTGITVGALLPVLYAREAWSELIDLSFSTSMLICRPWIFAAYAVTLWANHRYLRSALPAH